MPLLPNVPQLPSWRSPSLLPQTCCTTMTTVTEHSRVYLLWARHQLGIRVTWHFFKIQRFRTLIRPLEVDFLKLEPRCLDLSKAHSIFCCSAKQRPLYSDATSQTWAPLWSTPQSGGDGPGTPIISAAAQSCADNTLHKSA